MTRDRTIHELDRRNDKRENDRKRVNMRDRERRNVNKEVRMLVGEIEDVKEEKKDRTMKKNFSFKCKRRQTDE